MFQSSLIFENLDTSARKEENPVILNERIFNAEGVSEGYSIKARLIKIDDSYLCGTL